MTRISNWLATGAGAAGASIVAANWLRYGHVEPARGDAADPLLDRFMPEPEVADRHAVDIEAPADITMAAAKQMQLDDSRIVRAIFKARQLIMRGSMPDEAAGPTKGLAEAMTEIGWAVLADTPNEVVFGAVTKPWDANPVFRPIPADQFAGFAEPDFVKILWTLRSDARPDGGSTFRTDTRAIATDRGARKKFRLYWSVLSPGIKLIRTAMIPIVKDAAERAWRIEGDDLVPEPRAQLTHAITISAPPRDVWPWLLQMGCQRAGWYSWDRLDNGGKRSADHIIPELQHLEVGDVLPARPHGTEGFKVLRILPERALVLGSMSPEWDGTWAFELEPIGIDRTRLVTRYRAAFAPDAKMALALPLIARVHAFMEKKQLRTIKHHAEHLRA
jgi:hypothetical protein